jgi:hypothetical protein
LFSVRLHIRRNAVQLAPISLKLNSNSTINELKDKVSKGYDISFEKQVWMVRGKLIEDESVTLEQLGAVESEIFDLYLYSSFGKFYNSQIGNHPYLPDYCGAVVFRIMLLAINFKFV